MTYEINVIYPKLKEKAPRVMAAASEYSIEKIDMKSLEMDLLSLVKMLENLESKGEKYSVDEVKLTVGIAEDSEGKIHVGIGASLLGFLRGEAAVESGERISQNQLFEVIIRKR